MGIFENLNKPKLPLQEMFKELINHLETLTNSIRELTEEIKNLKEVIESEKVKKNSN